MTHRPDAVLPAALRAEAELRKTPNSSWARCHARWMHRRVPVREILARLARYVTPPRCAMIPA